jgi:hypothetical protein
MRQRLGTAFTLGVALALASCSEVTPPPEDGRITVPVTLSIANTPAVRAVVVEISAPDIDPTIVVNLIVDTVAQTASGTLTIPAGSARTITVRAYDAGGIETHQGSVTIDVTEGVLPSVTITIMPLNGTVPITVQIGAITISVAPAVDTVGVGDTLRLSAVVSDTNGVVLPVSVTWASLNPTLATVDTAGLVTAWGAGTVGIVASYAGVAAWAQLTIESDNTALDFASGWVTIPDHDDLDLTVAWTIEAWIKPRSVSGGHEHVISKWGDCSTASYSLVIGSGKLLSGIASCANGTQQVESAGNLVDGEWQHVAITLALDTLRLYINGVLDTVVPASQAPPVTATPVTFGRESTGLYPFDGLLDEVRIWTVARTTAEITAVMNQRLQGNEVGLMGYWRFDEGTGDVAFDATGRGHNAQLGSTAGPDANDPQWTTDAAPVN